MNGQRCLPEPNLNNGGAWNKCLILRYVLNYILGWVELGNRFYILRGLNQLYVVLETVENYRKQT